MARTPCLIFCFANESKGQQREDILRALDADRNLCLTHIRQRPRDETHRWRYEARLGAKSMEETINAVRRFAGVAKAHAQAETQAYTPVRSQKQTVQLDRSPVFA